MDNFPCTCGGENSNCFRCCGTGLVDKPLLGIGRPHRNLAEAAAKKTDDLALHNQALRRRKKRKQVDSYVRLQPVYTKCRECGAMVKNLSKHQRKMHRIQANENAIAARNKVIPSQEASQRRSVFSLANDQFSRTPTKARKPLLAKQYAKQTEKNATTEKHQKQSIDPRAASERDAMYGAGIFFRDNGQFGSYPLHDDMGDESFA